MRNCFFSSSFPTPATKAMFGSRIGPSFDHRPRFQAVYDARALGVYVAALLLVVHSVVAMVSAQPQTWPTLSGGMPIVVARGGFSGLYPDSSSRAYKLAMDTGTPKGTALWCDVQMTKDGVAICFPNIILNNGSNIDDVIKGSGSTYVVEGEAIPGYFSVDYKFDDLSPVRMERIKLSRTTMFETMYKIQTVMNLVEIINLNPENPPMLWLNVEHPSFYDGFNLSTTSNIVNMTKSVSVDYISSPDMSFLERIQSQLNSNTTKLVFRFRGESEKEPSTNRTYGSLLKDLEQIKTFASGIMIPKTYIWPLDSDNYLLPHTNVVSDAHKLELEVYASDFMNDAVLSYNYSYDPVAEYLNFIDNDKFSVDGLMTDHIITPADTLYCFTKHSSKPIVPKKVLIISKEGASGDYPGCTDMAYEKAINDGVDILDCPVQMSGDGTPFCLGSINLEDRTTVAQSTFSNRSITLSDNPEVNAGKGIYTFSLTWEEIRTLTPEISKPFQYLERNPKHKNEGKFLSLSDFLALTNKTNSLTGVLINITNAAYLAKNQGLGVVDAVLAALTKAGYNNKKGQRVMIQSTNKSVLMKFKNKGNYELVYHVDEAIRDVPPSTVNFVKGFADSVVVTKTSVFPQNEEKILNSSTDVVSKLKASGLSVYVETFSNEFVSQPLDFFSDPTVEIDAYVHQAGIDGLVTDFPKTAATYKYSECENFINEDFWPGHFITETRDPTPVAPSPVLTVSNVAEPPLPPVADKPPPPAGVPETAAAPATPIPRSFAWVFVINLAVLLADFSFGSNLFF